MNLPISIYHSWRLFPIETHYIMHDIMLSTTVCSALSFKNRSVWDSDREARRGSKK